MHTKSVFYRQAKFFNTYRCSSCYDFYNGFYISTISPFLKIDELSQNF